MTGHSPTHFPDGLELRDELLGQLYEADRDWLRSAGKRDGRARWATERAAAVRLIDDAARRYVALKAENARLKRRAECP
jgi:hypothetical protein